MHTLAHLEQQQDLVDGRVRPLHQDQFLLHSLHLSAVWNTRLNTEPFHGGVPFQPEQVLGETLGGAVLIVQSDQGFLEVGPQRPEHTGEHGALQRQVCDKGEGLVIRGNQNLF